MRNQLADLQWLDDMLEFIALLQKSMKGVTAEKFYKADPLYKCGYVIKVGKFILQPVFDNAQNFESNEAIVVKMNHQYIINQKGKTLREIEIKS